MDNDNTNQQTEGTPVTTNTEKNQNQDVVSQDKTAYEKEIEDANRSSINNTWADEAKGQGNDWKFGPRGIDDQDKPWVKTYGPEGLPGNTNFGQAFDGGTDERVSGTWNKGDHMLDAGGSDEEGYIEPVIQQEFHNQNPKIEVDMDEKDKKIAYLEARIAALEASLKPDGTQQLPENKLDKIAEQKGEKEEEPKENTYTDKDGKLVNIPLPIQEEMDLIFNKDSNVKNPEIAASYGFMENNLYNERLSSKIQELRGKGWSDKEISNYMNIAKYEIKDSVQQYVKGTVTRDIRLKVIDRILKDPEKYKDYIDPNTGKVIDAIVSENIIGEILGQKIYPEWELGERNAIPKPEIIEPDPNKERNWKRAALIAGVVAGGTTGILGGVPAAGIGALACIGAGVINKGVDFIGSRRINKLTEQLKTTTDPEAKAKIEKRIKNWEKARKGTEYVKSFLTGAKLGLLGSSIFSGVFMGGHGLVWNTPTPEIATGLPTSGPVDGTPPVETTPIDQGTPLTDGNIPTTELPTETYDLFANGRLNLPGSEMDGWRLADIPKGWEGVRLEDIPANQFANEGSKFFHMFIRDASAAGYTNAQISDAVSRMGPQVAHQIFRDGAYTGQNILQSMINGGWLPTN